MADHIICPNPNCGYRGEANPIARGSTALLCFLLLFCFLPGVIYLLFRGGYDNHCPRCSAYCGRAHRGPSSGVGPLLAFIIFVLSIAAGAAIVGERGGSSAPPAPIPISDPASAAIDAGPEAPAVDAGAARERRHRRRR